MKKIFTLFLALSVLTMSFAAVVEPPKKASQIYLPIGKEGTRISLMDLSEISVKDFQTLTGRKMGLFDKISFKASQRELRKSINADGTLNNEKLASFATKADGGFHIGGFALGFLLGLIGVLVAYLINDENKGSRVKWARLGLATVVVLWILIAVLA